MPVPFAYSVLNYFAVRHFSHKFDCLLSFVRPSESLSLWVLLGTSDTQNLVSKQQTIYCIS